MGEDKKKEWENTERKFHRPKKTVSKLFLVRNRTFMHEAHV